jgi:hypothetical protein
MVADASAHHLWATVMEVFMLPTRYRVAERGPGRWPNRRSPAPAGLWSTAREPYPAAIVLDDLAACGDDVAACTRVLARFAALRCALLAAGGLGGSALEYERSAALPYIEALPPGAEAVVLAELLRTAVAEPGPEIVRALRAAAALAGAHIHGTFALLRAAWSIALARRWDSLAAAAAADIAELALAAGAHSEARAWEQRAAAARGRA